MIISIIHPSRGRPNLAVKTAKDILLKSCYSEEVFVEYIFSLDFDDNKLKDYETLIDSLQQEFNKINFKIGYDNNRNVVQAMNKGAIQSTGDVLICTSDDFEFPLKWGIIVNEKIDITKPQALLVSQGVAKYTTNMALPIITRKMYESLGFIYYPEYTGMFADDDLTEACKVHGELINAPQLLFQHNHFLNGKSQIDDTYKRHNNKESWDLGKRVFEQRKLTGFK